MQIKKFWKLYPQSVRSGIIDRRLKITKKKRNQLKKFGKEYFDGDRSLGYGGYYYNSKFLRKIAFEMIKHYKLNNKSTILDIGCAKGFLMYEFKYFLPHAKVFGVDISKYCKKNAMENIKKYIKVSSCTSLPFKNTFFDFVCSISTIHNLNIEGINQSLQEINRVKKKNSFIRVKAHKNKEETQTRMAKTQMKLLHPDLTPL